VKGEGFRDELIQMMETQMRELIGNRLSIRIVFSDTIDKSPIGKAKLVEQELDMRNYIPGA